MKKCPKCGQTYTDKDLNFCYNDGELLSYAADEAPTRVYSDGPGFADDPPPTEFLPAARVTSETTWNPPQAPPAVWQGGQQVQTPFSQFPTHAAKNQTLPIVSMALGIFSLTGICCSLGYIAAPAALITAIIGLVQIKNDPDRYAGKGFAFAGIGTAAISLAILVLFILIYGLAMLLG